MPGSMPGVHHPVVNARKALQETDAGGVPAAAGQAIQRAWSPYQDNGGTVLAIRGKDFVVVAADTRMSRGYTVMDPNTTKCSELPGGIVLASGGMQADRNHLHKVVNHRLAWYQYRHKKVADVHAVGQMLSIQCYNRRFFPLYAYNIIGGVDKEGKGVVYGYDVVGCMESVSHVVAGSGRDLIEPMLDCQMQRYNIQGQGPNTDITREQAVDMAKDAIKAASRRDLETAPQMEIFLITANGVEKQVL